MKLQETYINVTPSTGLYFRNGNNWEVTLHANAHSVYGIYAEDLERFIGFICSSTSLYITSSFLSHLHYSTPYLAIKTE